MGPVQGLVSNFLFLKSAFSLKKGSPNYKRFRAHGYVSIPAPA